MKKVVLVILAMIALLCVKEQQSSAYFNQEAAEQTSDSGAPEFDEALEAELNNALQPVSDFNKFNSEPSPDSETARDFESTMERILLGAEKKQPYELAKISFTAYYGPKKNQGDYYNGSFAEDVRINGPGIETACKGEPP